MKKIVIHSQDGIDARQKLWAREAAHEFLEMFPEYRNSFRIEFRDDAHLTHKEISQAEYDALPDNAEKLQFIRTANGTWLVPYESMQWFVEQAKKPNRRRGTDKIDVHILTALQFARIQRKAPDEYVVSIVKGDFDPNCYGLTNGDAFTLSSDSCQEKEFFKTIFIHEMGHIFNATHANRAHTIQRNGPHCTNPLCIMGASNYHQLRDERLRRRANGQPPFCDDCISSMRDYMANIQGLTREIQVEHHTPPQPQQPRREFMETLPVLPHNNNNWKNEFREFYQNTAARDGDTYSEDTNSQNYLARIKRPDGSSLEIEANNEYNVAIGTANAPDGDDIPPLKDMRDLVKLAQQKNSGMNFGRDNEPEFNARLMIACLEVRPQPLAMRNQPDITPEFLAQLKPQTKRQLQNLINPPTGRRQQHTR